MRNCPDVTILINLFGQDQSQGALGGHGSQGGWGGRGGRGGQGGWCGQVAGVVKVFRVVRVRVILSESLKWQRFLKVICCFLKVICLFLKVICRFLKVICQILKAICRFLKVILTRDRYRAARAAKNTQLNLNNLKFFHVYSVHKVMASGALYRNHFCIWRGSDEIAIILEGNEGERRGAQYLVVLVRSSIWWKRVHQDLKFLLICYQQPFFL